MRTKIDMKKLRRMYYEEKGSLRKIAPSFNCRHNTLLKFMQLNNLPRRTISESLMGNTHTLGYKHSKATRKKVSECKKGDKHYRWKGGKKTTVYGYILKKNEKHPYANKMGYVLEHRLIMETNIGRYLKSKEIVHHINNIKSDNRIDNLFLFPNNRLHSCFHMIKKFNKSLNEEIFMNFVYE